MSAVKDFCRIASEDRFNGWPLVGEPELGPRIPFFGQTLNYKLETGNGIEDYTSIIRSFGWAVCFGVTTNDEIITLVQWKPGVNQASWELPPGGCGKVEAGTSDEEIMRLSQDTYLKETGYGNGEWQMLGTTMIETGKYRGAGPNDHGLRAHMYLATDLERMQDARKPNPNEIMETLLVPLREFPDVLESGCFNEVSAELCAFRALQRLRRL